MLEFDEIIKIDQFETIIINIVFGWAERYLRYRQSEINESFNVNKKNTLQYWEVLWLEKAKGLLKENFYGLVNAADFWDMEELTTSLCIFIGKELTNVSVDQIRLDLFDEGKFFNKNFPNSILYQILVQKSQTETLALSYATNRAVTSLFRADNCVGILHKELSFDDFVFLHSLYGNHIKYNHKQLNDYPVILYDNMSQNFNIVPYLRRIMNTYVAKEDLSDALIAGGIFWNYRVSQFSQNFPDLFKNFSDQQDIDIFILDDSINSKQMMYYKKIFEPIWEKTKKLSMRKFLGETITESLSIYDGVDSFKIFHEDGQIINFIFVSKDKYASLLLFIDDFDFSVSKTYYSYEADALFLPIEILLETERMAKKYDRKVNFVDVRYLIETSFIEYYSLLLMLIKSEFEPDFTNLTINLMDTKESNESERKRKFIKKNASDLKRLCESRKLVYRIFKYCFKNNFDKRFHIENSLAINKLNFYYRIFSSQINKNKFTFENVTESIFDYMKSINKI